MLIYADCIVFLFCFSSSCVPYVTSFSELSIFDCPSVFSNILVFFIGNCIRTEITVMYLKICHDGRKYSFSGSNNVSQVNSICNYQISSSNSVHQISSSNSVHQISSSNSVHQINSSNQFIKFSSSNQFIKSVHQISSSNSVLLTCNAVVILL